MALTKAEELLLRGLKLSKLRRGNVILAMMLMDTEEKRWEMILILKKILENDITISEEEIMDIAQRIART